MIDGTVVVRGSSAFDDQLSDSVLGGNGGWTTAPDGFGIRAEEEGEAFVSGTLIDPISVLPPATVTTLAVPEPFLRLEGTVAAGATVRLDAFAPEGELLFLAASLGLKPLQLAGWEGTIWLAPSGVLSVNGFEGQGQGTPVSLDLYLAPDLPLFAGQEVVLQLFAPLVPGTVNPNLMLAANPVTLLPR